ncbi:AMP-binding enzyme, partial [Streptomyces lucensis]|uniref:AMP-binding enzyme n=1 Tax=Streptomyces lucensis TaxID=67319 RepID=UPI00167A7599
LDEHLQPVPTGVTGELYLAGTGLAHGYLNRPALTAQRFIADPHGQPGTRMYRTGDLARWTTNGELVYAGRTDRQIKIRGYRIEPGEIEAHLRTRPDITQAVVLPHPHTATLTAYLVPTPGTHPDPTQLRHELSHTLPHFMIPTSYTLIDELPLTPNGKLDTKALPQP